MIASFTTAQSPKVGDDRYNERLYLFETHLHLASLVARRVLLNLPSSIDSDEVFSSARLGLWNATDTYNPAFGSTFETYARVRIRGKILDDIREMDSVSRSVRLRQRTIVDATEDLRQKFNREPLPFEIAQHVGLSVRDLEKQQFELHPTTSLDAEVCGADDDSPALHEIIADENWVHPASAIGSATDQSRVREALRTLDNKDQTLLDLHFLRDLSLLEIANLMGVTESRVCQMMAIAIGQLKSALKKQPRD